MKLTQRELKRLITEEVKRRSSVLLEMPMGSTAGTKMHAQDNYPNGRDPDGYEGNMAKKSLYHMARQADQLHDIIVDDENLEPWVQDKISAAAKGLEAAFKSIMYDKDNPEGR